MLYGVRQPVGLHLGADLRHIMTEHDDVMLLALDIPHMVAQQRFGLEAEAFEQRDRRLLIDRHLHRKLFKAGPQRQREGLLRQRPSDALAANILRHDHSDLADMRRPRMRISHQRTAPDRLPLLHRQQAADVAALDLIDPGRQHLGLADIARQEQEIAGGKLLREIEHRGFVGAGHQTEFNIAGVGLGMQRVGTCVTHVDLSPSQESSFGHSRLMALAPATRLTWPPFSITSSLSIEPIFWISGFAAAWGARWSCSATACRIGTLILEMSAARPPTDIVSL